LADDDTIAAFERLIRIATVTTPNLPEFDILSNAESVPKGIATLLKGGHGEGATVIDRLLVDGVERRHWANPRIDTQHTHGTGCTLASSIAIGLARGLPIDRAIAFVRAALANAAGLGGGHGPMGHALGVIPFDEIEG
jgi:hydroxymethylpyrimidine/phosphomethylpyrimidine kinase